MQGEEQDLSVCPCCGQMRSYPTKAGLWEYLPDPIFNPDGSLKTEHRGDDIVWQKDGQGLDKPMIIPRVYPCEQVWQRVNIVDASEATKGRDEYRLLVVPVGNTRAIWWPNKALWRKVGDKPEIDWRDVVAEGVRLGDGERVPCEEDE